MNKFQSLYMWEIFDMIIQRIESQIDLISKTTDLYDSQYFSKDNEYLFASIFSYYPIISAYEETI